MIWRCDRLQFLLTDQIGTLRAVADTSGNIVKRIDYDSFGNIIADSNPAFTVPFGFAGGLHDRDTGLVRFGYRDYSPELGRFVAKDPLDFAGGDTNLYAYVHSDPINFIDPYGLEDLVKGSVVVRIYNMFKDHAPAHAHVIGGGPETRVGPLGYPLAGDPPLTHQQQTAVNQCKPQLRSELNRLGRARMRAGLLGAILGLFEFGDIQRRADQSGKDFFQQAVEDMVGPQDLSL